MEKSFNELPNIISAIRSKSPGDQVLLLAPPNLSPELLTSLVEINISGMVGRKLSCRHILSTKKKTRLIVDVGD